MQAPSISGVSMRVEPLGKLARVQIGMMWGLFGRGDDGVV
jgi:hypothetical protein